MSNNKRAIMLESLQSAKTRCGAVAAVSSRLSLEPRIGKL
jgi:hypothetical protein